MNEKIKELYDQSQKVSHYIDGGYTPIMTLDVEKFAELIVKECISVYETDPSIYHEVNIGNILEHFGLE